MFLVRTAAPIALACRKISASLRNPSLVALTSRQIAEPEQRASQHASLTPGGCSWRVKPVFRNVIDGFLDGLQNGLRGRVAWVKAAEHMGQFRQANSRVVANSQGQELIDCSRRASLEDIDIDAGVEEQRRAYLSLVRCPLQVSIVSTLKPPRSLVRLEQPQRALEIKCQDRLPQECSPSDAGDGRRSRPREPTGTMPIREARYPRSHEPASWQPRQVPMTLGRTVGRFSPRQEVPRLALAQEQSCCGFEQWFPHSRPRS